MAIVTRAPALESVIAAVAAELPPREYIFVVDVSGSMSGFPLDVSKGLLKQLFATLTPRDSFNILLFSGGSTLLAPESLPAAVPFPSCRSLHPETREQPPVTSRFMSKISSWP